MPRGCPRLSAVGDGGHMALRWRMLAVLFLARLSMAFQFQAVGSVSPLVGEAYGVDLTGIGMLIGLYFAPGIAIALPGGWIGARLGDTRVVAAGLGLMVAGAAIALVGESWTAEIAGRLLAGFGAIFLNVLTTKMVADWFAGREIATAMAIFVNSWPVGIALALIVLPAIGTALGLAAVTAAVGLLSALGFLLVVLVYRAPDATTATPGLPRLAPRVLRAVLLAGTIWGFYNAAIGMMFSFGPSFLTERGWDIVASGRLTSLVLWLLAATIPLGGIVADRSGRPVTVILVSFALTGAALFGTVTTSATTLCLALAGLGSGLAAGPIVSLPARVLEPATRSVGMGVFFTVYYVMMMALPALAGALADRTGSTAATLFAGIGFLALATVALAAFRVAETRPAAVPA